MNERALATAARLLETEDWEFTTQLGPKAITVYGTAHDETEEFNLTIRWALMVDLREWGVKSMDVDIRSVQGHGTINHDEDGSLVRAVTISWPQRPRPTGTLDDPTEELAAYMAEPNWKIKTTFRRDNDVDGKTMSLTVKPSFAEIDLRRQIIEIEFY